MPLPRSVLALALAIATTPALAADDVTVEDLARRLKALELRLGTAETSSATEATNNVADLDQRLRVIERKLELQAEADAARTASTPVVTMGEKGLSVKSPPPRRFRDEVPRPGAGRRPVLVRRLTGPPERTRSCCAASSRRSKAAGGRWSAYRLTGAARRRRRHDQRCLRRPEIRSARNGAHGQVQDPGRTGAAAIQRHPPTGRKRLSVGTRPRPRRRCPAAGRIRRRRHELRARRLQRRPRRPRRPVQQSRQRFRTASGRVFFEPWKNAANGLSGLGFGIAGSTGDKDGPRQRLPAALPDARARCSSSAIAATSSPTANAHPAGRRRRISTTDASGCWPNTSPPTRTSSPRQRRRGATMDNRAGSSADERGADRRGQQLPAAWPVPTIPLRSVGQAGAPLNWSRRYGRLDIDDDAFPLFADPASRPLQARRLEPRRQLVPHQQLQARRRLQRRPLSMAAPAGLEREDEKAFLTRAQFSF